VLVLTVGRVHTGGILLRWRTNYRTPVAEFQSSRLQSNSSSNPTPKNRTRRSNAHQELQNYAEEHDAFSKDKGHELPASIGVTRLDFQVETSAAAGAAGVSDATSERPNSGHSTTPRSTGKIIGTGFSGS